MYRVYNEFPLSCFPGHGHFWPTSTVPRGPGPTCLATGWWDTPSLTRRAGQPGRPDPETDLPAQRPTRPGPATPSTASTWPTPPATSSHTTSPLTCPTSTPPDRSFLHSSPELPTRTAPTGSSPTQPDPGSSSQTEAQAAQSNTTTDPLEGTTHKTATAKATAGILDTQVRCETI